MDDENGIELSLGLSCGGSTSKSKTKDGYSDNKTEEEDNNKVMDGNVNVAEVSLKHFFHTNFEKQDSTGPQRSESSTHTHENFWTDLGKSTGQDAHVFSNMQGNSSQFPRFQELWGANNKSAEVNEGKSCQLEINGKPWTEAFNKRKMSFEDIKNYKKREEEIEHANAHSKSHMGINHIKNSHVSATTEDGSTAENEDVAESEAEGSTSRLVSQNDDSYKGSVSDFPKDELVVTDSLVIDTQVQKTTNVGGKQSSLEQGNLTFGVPLQFQAQPAVSVPYSLPGKIPTEKTTSGSTGFPSSMQFMPHTSNERPIIQSMNPSSLQLAFGYSAVQLPTLETGSSWGVSSHPQRFSGYVGKGPSDMVQNADNSKDDLKRSQAAANIHASHHMTEEMGTCSSSQKEDETKGNNIFKPKEASDQSAAEFFPEGSAIRPGVAAGVKFGGCGSHPDLPWVSTTGSGPNGKTISGVTYRCSPNQVRIVCACHGSHMSPDEFVEHASADAPNPENSSGHASFPNNNPAASTQS